MSKKEVGFTIIISTYDRLNDLKHLLTTLDTISNLKEIIIVWRNRKLPIPSSKFLMNQANITKPIVILPSQNNKESKRYDLSKNITLHRIQLQILS